MTKFERGSKARKVVVLLGMHRSGTSLAMSMLQSMGVSCGADLIPAAESNKAGFWEHAQIVAEQEHLLARLQRIWHGPKGTHPFPEDWLDSEAARRAESRLREIVSAELGAAPDIWGFKDPRTSRLLPLWNRVFASLDIEPIYILSTRHPNAVTTSLHKHNGMAASRGELVWMMHNLDALRDAAEKLALVVDYDSIIDQPEKQAARLAKELRRVVAVSAEQEAAAAARVSPSMRRSSVADRSISNAVVGVVHDGLAAMAADGPCPQELQWLAGNIGSLQACFSPWITDTRSPLTDWMARVLLREKYR